jgi:hypothetical protein
MPAPASGVGPLRALLPFDESSRPETAFSSRGGRRATPHAVGYGAPGRRGVKLSGAPQPSSVVRPNVIAKDVLLQNAIRSEKLSTPIRRSRRQGANDDRKEARA